jgi:hypothetical protein
MSGGPMTASTRDRSKITDVTELTPEERRNHADTFPHVEHFDCVHGHENCSIKRGGVCIEDVLDHMTLHGEE